MISPPRFLKRFKKGANNGQQRPLWQIPNPLKLIRIPFMNIFINKKGVINTTTFHI